MDTPALHRIVWVDEATPPQLDKNEITYAPLKKPDIDTSAFQKLVEFEYVRLYTRYKLTLHECVLALIAACPVLRYRVWMLEVHACVLDCRLGTISRAFGFRH
jgi:hypothetical protein